MKTPRQQLQPDLSPQEIFSHVWNHFVVERRPFSAGLRRCYYRGLDGAACAVGLFIPDSEYYPEMETLGGVGMICNNARLSTSTRAFLKKHRTLFVGLQKAHDNAAARFEQGLPYRQWLRSSMSQVAHAHGLKAR